VQYLRLAKMQQQQQQQQQNRQSWTRTDKSEERHKGSFPLEEITASDEYKNREVPANTFKRKYALCFGYLGTAYQGLQINPGACTVERELEKALLLSGGLSKANFGHLHKISFSRAGRTDRGVHAVTQCCAMKLEFPLGAASRDAFLARLNRALPTDIRALAATKVSKAFNSKNFCTHRRYQYLLPTYALMPALQMNALLQRHFDKQGPVEGAAHAGGYVEASSGGELGAEALRRVHAELRQFRVAPEQLAALRKALAEFQGTHPMHNFTSGKHPLDQDAKRYILHFTCGEPYIPLTADGEEAAGVEYVLLEVLGQSFLLHQIRKMVALAAEVGRGAAPLRTVRDAFMNKKVDVPTAPSVGLYLAGVRFDGYNQKMGQEVKKEKKRLASQSQQQAQQLKQKHLTNQANQKAASLAAAVDGKEGGEVKGEGEEGPVLKKARADETSAVAAPATVGTGSRDEGEEGEEGGGPCVEEILWESDPTITAATRAFRDEVLHPHVLREACAGLHFLYFVDFLRTHPHPYETMTEPYGPQPPKKKGGGKRGNGADGVAAEGDDSDGDG